jgi:hypothetical protein
MRHIVLLGLYLLIQGCSHSDNYNRGYVISHLEAEQEAPPAEEPEIN